MNKYALITGYDAKPYAPINAVACAKLLQGILVDNGFSRQNIKMIIGSRSSKQDVIDGFNWLKIRENPEDEVILGFFGHGGGNGVALYKGGITHTEIKDLALPLESTKQLILIDTCGSAGAILEGSDGVTLCKPNRIVITSTMFEAESSVLTGRYTDWAYAFLIYSLQQGMGDLNGDGKVHIQEAYYASGKGLMCDGYGQDFYL